MYLNRENINAINRLKMQWGPDRFSQTNSRKNGCYLKHVRLYSTATDKARRRNYRELHTLEDIIAAMLTFFGTYEDMVAAAEQNAISPGILRPENFLYTETRNEGEGMKVCETCGGHMVIARRIVENMKSANGNSIPNQFIIRDDSGTTFFQSYKTIIAKRENGKITLDRDSWNYSRTTGKYRNQFLMENKSGTEYKIKSGEYALADLNA